MPALPEIPDDGAGVRYPVVKRQRIGERFAGVICETPHQRDVLKKNTTTGEMEPVRKSNGKNRQELVVTLLALPGTDAVAGIGDSSGVPEPGDPVRMIQKGGGFAQWIEAKNAHGKLHIGDVVEHVTEYAQQYNQDGDTVGGKITDQATADAIPRSQSVGFYGTLTIRSARAEEAQWVTKAVEHYNGATAVAVADVDPF